MGSANANLHDLMALSFFHSDPFFAPRRHDALFTTLMTHDTSDLDAFLHASATGLACDVLENENDFSVRASLPGIKESDISITHKDGLLMISADSGSEVDEERDGFHHREIRSGHFSRSIRLPKTADFESNSVTASLENGILQITVPKKSEALPKQITITTPGSSL